MSESKTLVIVGFIRSAWANRKLSVGRDWFFCLRKYCLLKTTI